jgi:staphylococcal nuclease domain-containing protein 1
MSSASFPYGQGMAVVKSVLSGDSVIIRGKAANGPPPEAIVSLGNITAPRNQEPFAFESKEFLRSLLVGKQVAYKINYTSASNQHIGSLALNVEDGDVSKMVVKNGFARAKSLDSRKIANEEHLILAELEKTAENQKVGIWSGKCIERELISNWREEQDPRAFISKMKDKPIPGIVEQVRDGSTVKVLLILEGNLHQIITMCISGIQAPVCRVGVPNMDDVTEPYGEEAKCNHILTQFSWKLESCKEVFMFYFNLSQGKVVQFNFTELFSILPEISLNYC